MSNALNRICGWPGRRNDFAIDQPEQAGKAGFVRDLLHALGLGVELGSARF
jgi:hypothetical protein